VRREETNDLERGETSWKREGGNEYFPERIDCFIEGSLGP